MHDETSGFSLIEILVSGAILASVLVALMMLLSYSARSSNQARNRTLASELMQEGVDFFRQERSTLSWRGLNLVVAAGSDYCLSNLERFSVSVEDNVFDDFSSADNCEFTNMHSDIQTKFKRVAYVTKPDDSTIAVQIEVSWQTGRIIGQDQANVSSTFYLKGSSTTD